MRNTTFVRTLSCCISLFCLVALGMICRLAFAQDATPAVAPAKEAPAVAALPSDPKELMLLAAKTNGLTGDDVQPWHVEATYQLLDEQGSVRDQGTYEEFWVSPPNTNAPSPARHSSIPFMGQKKASCFPATKTCNSRGQTKCAVNSSIRCRARSRLKKQLRSPETRSGRHPVCLPETEGCQWRPIRSNLVPQCR